MKLDLLCNMISWLQKQFFYFTVGIISKFKYSTFNAYIIKNVDNKKALNNSK